MTPHKIGTIIGIMLGEALKGFCFGIGAIADLIFGDHVKVVQ